MNYKILNPNSSSGFLIVASNNKFGIINQKGKLVQEIIYDAIGDISILNNYDEDKLLIPFILNNKIGWFNLNYKIEIQPNFEFATDIELNRFKNLFFENKYLCFRALLNNNNANVIIDRFGNNCTNGIEFDYFQKMFSKNPLSYFKGGEEEQNEMEDFIVLYKKNELYHKNSFLFYNLNKNSSPEYWVEIIRYTVGYWNTSDRSKLFFNNQYHSIDYNYETIILKTLNEDIHINFDGTFKRDGIKWTSGFKRGFESLTDKRKK